MAKTHIKKSPKHQNIWTVCFARNTQVEICEETTKSEIPAVFFKAILVSSGACEMCKITEVSYRAEMISWWTGNECQCQTFSASSFSDVKIWCFSMSYMIVNLWVLECRSDKRSNLKMSSQALIIIIIIIIKPFVIVVWHFTDKTINNKQISR